MKLYELIAQTISARANCIMMARLKDKNEHEFIYKHEETLLKIAQHLPSGSGIDSGTVIDYDASNENKIVLLIEYHHMNDCGMYDGWTAHKMILTPAFIGGFDMRITGRDRNDIKSYLADTYNHALNEEVEYKDFQ